MNKLYLAARMFLGIIFAVFGLNGFLAFIPPPELPEGAMAFMGGLASASYFFPVLKLAELVTGVMLIAGKFVPLALLIAAPIVLQINLFHIFLAPDPMGTGMGVALLLAGLAVAHQNKERFEEVLKI